MTKQLEDEQLKDDITEILLTDYHTKDKVKMAEFRCHLIGKLIRQGHQEVRKVLEKQIELWELAEEDLSRVDDAACRVRFMDMYDPVGKLKDYLEK